MRGLGAGASWLRTATFVEDIVQLILEQLNVRGQIEDERIIEYFRSSVRHSGRQTDRLKSPENDLFSIAYGFARNVVIGVPFLIYAKNCPK